MPLSFLAVQRRSQVTLSRAVIDALVFVVLRLPLKVILFVFLDFLKSCAVENPFQDTCFSIDTEQLY